MRIKSRHFDKFSVEILTARYESAQGYRANVFIDIANSEAKSLDIIGNRCHRHRV